MNTEWPGGLYFSPTLAGSRPGGLSAACWAAMVSMGESGYLEAARGILETAAEVKRGIREIAGLHVLGDPLFTVAFASDEVDIYAVADVMEKKGWSLNGLQLPPALHIAITNRHARPGFAKRFLADLAGAVETVRQHPEMEGFYTPIYGMTSNVMFKDAVEAFLKEVLDLVFEV